VVITYAATFKYIYKRQAITYNVAEACSRNQCCRGKAVSINYCVCILALVVQHAKCMRRIILSSAACTTLPYFSMLSHKWHDFRKKLLNIKCVLIFPAIFS
jgi:hypothetical protein